MDKGTITWFSIKENGLPPSDPSTKWLCGTYSKQVLISDGICLHYTKQCYLPNGFPTDWFGGNNIPFTPTHWAFINLPS